MEQRYSATVLNDAVDFVKLAEAMGAKGIRVTTQEEFKEAFKEALASREAGCDRLSDRSVMIKYGRW